MQPAKEAKKEQLTELKEIPGTEIREAKKEKCFRKEGRRDHLCPVLLNAQ